MTVSAVFPETGEAVRGLLAGARLHGDRFHKPRLVSLATLVTPSKRYITEDAVATVTVVPSVLRLAAYACAWLSAAAATALALAALVTARIVGTPLGAPGVMAGAVAAALAVVGVIVTSAGLSRRIDTRRRWPGAVGDRVVGDVASRRPGAGGEIIANITRDADTVGQTLVLRVRSDNRAAVDLYARHGFRVSSTNGDMTAMTRPPGRSVSPPSLPKDGRPWSRSRVLWIALLAAVVMGLVWLYWATPVVWAVPITGMVAAAAAVVDLQERRIPNLLTATGLALSVGSLAYSGGATLLADAGIGAAIMAGPLLATHIFTRDHMPGLGDVKLAAVLGLTAGAIATSAAFVALVCILLGGAVFGIVWKRVTGDRAFPLAVPMCPIVVAVLVVWALADYPTTWS